MKQSESALLGKHNSFGPMKGSEIGDKISELPDAVLGHILSLIPFKQSVETSILSKRWLRVWMYLPLVDIDDSTLLLRPIVVAEPSVHSSFINFMTNVFNRPHEAPILKFILKCTKFDVFRFNQWIVAAVMNRVRELDFCITMKYKFEITASLFAYRELAALKLGNRFVLHVQGSLVFPNLKKLHLDGIEIDDDDDTIHRLLSGCPVLEDLHISCTEKSNCHTLVIEAPALKFLTIDYFLNNLYNHTRFKFILESPNLEVLDFSASEGIKGHCFGNLTSLAKAKIDICGYHIMGANAPEGGFEIVSAIVNAKTICLTDCTLEILSSMDVCDLPIFHNLTELQLGISDCCSGLLFSQLLCNSPNLQVIVLDAELAECGDKNQFRWERPSRVPNCVARRLKVVNAFGYDDNACVSEFIKYVLQHGQVLEECTSPRGMKSNSRR